MRHPVCVDLDNVIARTDEVLRCAIREHSQQGVDLAYEDVTDFDYWKCTDRFGRRLQKHEWPLIHREFTLNYLDRIEPFEEVDVHLQNLQEYFEIHIATSRLPEGHAATKRWLQRHALPFLRLHFVRHRKKHEIQLPFVAAIEDDRVQAELFAAKGVRGFLLAHPWNDQSGGGIERVLGWAELVDKVVRNCGP